MPELRPIPQMTNPPDMTSQPLPKMMASIPNATDLKSAIAAVNALKQLVATFINPRSGSSVTPKAGSGVGTDTGGPGVSGTGKLDPGRAIGRWAESHRTSQIVRIYNPLDHEQYVDVKRINQLTMKNTVTNETWIWERVPGGGATLNG